MQRYKSVHTGAQIDSGVERALPGGEIDASLSNNAADHPHRNLLDNWDFRNPVNQRGQTNYAVNGYTIDSWHSDHAVAVSTISFDSTGLSFTLASGDNPYTDFTNRLESYIISELTEKCVTFSIDVNGEVKSTSWIFGTDLYIGSGIAGIVFVSTGALGYHPLLRFIGNSFTGLRRVKLELGSVSTLANDPPVDYGAELTRCKRYFNLWATEAARAAALLEVGAMRTTPVLSTIDIGGVTYYTASADL